MRREELEEIRKEIIRAECEAKAKRYFALQSVIDSVDGYFHDMEELIGDVTSRPDTYQEFKRHVDMTEVYNFYLHIRQICDNIVKYIERAEK